MKIKQQSLLIALLLSRFFLLGQTDSSVRDSFYPHKGLFYLSVGSNRPIGPFSSIKAPFSDGFALPNIILQGQYSKPVYQKLSIMAGLFFSRNNFDDQKCNKAYLDTYGDTIAFPAIQYQNIGFYAGVSYSYPVKRFLFTANLGLGLVYTSPIISDSFVYLYPRPGPNSTGLIKEWGTLAIGKTFNPLILYGLDVKYLLKGGLFISAHLNYIGSSVRYKLWDRQTEIMNRNIPFENLAITVGLGTVFR